MQHRITTINESGTESGLILRSRLTLGLESKFREEYRQAFNDDQAPSRFTTSMLLLTVYATDWYGPLFAAPFSEHALLNYDGDMALIYQAMDWCYQRFFAEPIQPEQPTNAAPDDPSYQAMVKRWERKLGDDSANVRAGHHDQIVSLMARFNWTERQVLEDNSPEVIQELCARLEAEANISKRKTDKKPRRSRGTPAGKSFFVNMWDQVKALAAAGGTNG